MREAIDELANDIETTFPDLPNRRWVALRLLEGDKRIVEAFRNGELGDLTRGSAEDQGSLANAIEVM